MAFKYDVVHVVTGDGCCSAPIPTALKDKTFTSFNKVVRAVCDALPVGDSCTVRKVETNKVLGDMMMGFREVTPEKDGCYSYQRGWAHEY